LKLEFGIWIASKIKYMVLHFIIFLCLMFGCC
jgi:hypothetical protein